MTLLAVLTTLFVIDLIIWSVLTVVFTRRYVGVLREDKRLHRPFLPFVFWTTINGSLNLLEAAAYVAALAFPVIAPEVVFVIPLALGARGFTFWRMTRDVIGTPKRAEPRL